jgi:effector-binding domain-containing protein
LGVSEIRIAELPEESTAMIRKTVGMAELKDFFDWALPAVATAVEASGARIAGPPFARYFGMPADNFEVEAGFPVSGRFDGAGQVRAGSLPAGQVVEATHVGPYETLAQTHTEIGQWLAERGLQPSDEVREYYLSDPGAEPDPSSWRTRVVWPVR